MLVTAFSLRTTAGVGTAVLRTSCAALAVSAVSLMRPFLG